MIKRALRDIYHHLRMVQYRNRIINEESKHMSQISLVDLSKEEMASVNKRWKGVSPLRILPKYYQMFKTLEHFDDRFVSDDLFMPFILRTLNNESESNAFVHKGLYDILFKGVIERPRTIINNINGTFFDSDMNPLGYKDAVSLLQSEHSFIIKPTVGSCMGRGVKKVDTNLTDIESLLLEYKENFIAQQIVPQSEMTSVFNPSSLNTFRISTLNLNGVVSACTIMFRCGQGDSIVDNGGAGGLMIGVDQQGRLRNYAYNNKYDKVERSYNGILFSDKSFEQVPMMVEMVKELHQRCLPSMGFAGWDIALNNNNTPLMIEVNLVWPGIQFEQLCPGTPIFGNRTDEVIEYVIKRKRW